MARNLSSSKTLHYVILTGLFICLLILRISFGVFVTDRKHSLNELHINTTTCAFLFQTLVHSIPLYFSVKAQNSMGLSAVTSCELPTYDMTLPEGRIIPDFRSTSHRELLQGSALALDDSVIKIHQVTKILKEAKANAFVIWV